MRIAICDDESAFTDRLDSVLKPHLQPDDFTVIFHNGIDLLSDFKKEPYDIVLLDIEMPGINGMEAAKRIREIAPDTLIIVITDYAKYAVQGYEFKAFHFLLKPLNIIKLKQVIDDAREFLRARTGKAVRVSTRDREVYVPVRSILYINSYRRMLCLHTHDKTYEYYQKIGKAEADLKDAGFYRTHNTCIINLPYINHVIKSKRLAVLYNGTELPISKERMDRLMGLIYELKGIIM